MNTSVLLRKRHTFWVCYMGLLSAWFAHFSLYFCTALNRYGRGSVFGNIFGIIIQQGDQCIMIFPLGLWFIAHDMNMEIQKLKWSKLRKISFKANMAIFKYDPSRFSCSILRTYRLKRNYAHFFHSYFFAICIPDIYQPTHVCSCDIGTLLTFSLALRYISCWISQSILNFAFFPTCWFSLL